MGALTAPPIRGTLVPMEEPSTASNSEVAALRPRGRGSLPHRGKNLAAKKLDAGEDLILAHPRPTHAHRKVVDAAAMLGDQHIDDTLGRAHGEPLGRQRAELLFGGGVWIESESLQAPRE